MKKRVSFFTLGCKLNQYETDNIKDKFIRSGYSVIKFGEQADVSLINTCTVTKSAEFKSRQTIRRAIRFSPGAFIIVVGCYSQVSAEEIGKIPGVDLILGSMDKFNVLDFLDDFEKTDKSVVKKCIGDCKVYNEEGSGYSTDRTRAFLKIQDGCNYYCSYCIIPYARGKSRSRNSAQIIKQAAKLAKSGFNEIVLTAVNLAEYNDKNCGNLTGLLRKLVSIDNLPRIRLSSIEINKMDDEFIELIADSQKICKHLHIPLQNGDDKILSLMKRKYNLDFFRRKIEKITSKIPGIGIGTDVMVGFPGEEKENFNNTLKFIEKIPFSYMHIFTYSERKFTEAYNFSNKVDKNEIKRRSQVLRDIAKEKKADFLQKNIGKTENVVFEAEEEDNIYSGFTSNYIRVRSKGKNLNNKLKKVKLIKSNDSYVTGEILN